MENFQDCSQEKEIADLGRLQVLDMPSKPIVHQKDCEDALGGSKALEGGISGQPGQVSWRDFLQISLPRLSPSSSHRHLLFYGEMLACIHVGKRAMMQPPRWSIEQRLGWIHDFRLGVMGQTLFKFIAMRRGMRDDDWNGKKSDSMNLGRTRHEG